MGTDCKAVRFNRSVKALSNVFEEPLFENNPRARRNSSKTKVTDADFRNAFGAAIVGDSRSLRKGGFVRKPHGFRQARGGLIFM